jgi:protein translocase SecG subunit
MLLIIHAIVGILLALSIMLQQRASGLSATFGGTGSSYVQRRGGEAVIYKATVWLAVVFFGLGILQLFV